MDNARLKRILTIVDTTLSLDPKKREGYLTEVCGDDDILREEVVKLLKSIDTSEGFWEDWQDWNKQQINRLFQEPEKDRTEFGQIGSWRLIKRLGRGGMGSVYLAERADGQYEQQAAVKLLQHGLEAGESVRRFEQERQILAKLDHPNIAGLYEGGITEDGRPWLAMQYVDGIPITEWCKQKSCTLQSRIELFKKVCEAVRYAHRNLIVHRDLKSENILVTKDGAVKVLDFGIAKLLDEELSEAQRIHTQTGLRVMSLDYAAPEQITGEPITTATDVYALGLLLYELLAEKYPFDLKNKNQRQVEQVLRNQDPKKPSSAATKWQGEVRGDLDAITLKALRKEPDHRYENAGQLLDDIEKYHSNLPVSARSDTNRYRLSKFYKRHRGKLAAAAVVLISISGLVTYYTIQLTEERNEAQVQAKKAEQTSEFLTDLFKASDPGEALGEEITAGELLERGSQKIEGSLVDEPEVKASVLEMLGKVYKNMGQYEKAQSQLERSLVLRRDNLEPYHQDIAGNLNKIATTQLYMGRRDEAKATLLEAMEIHQKSTEPNYENFASTLNNLAAIFLQHQNLDSAEVMLRKAVGIRRQHTEDNTSQIATNLDGLAITLERKGEKKEAEALYQESLKIRQMNLDADHPDVARSFNNLAGFMYRKRDLESAESLYRQALDIWHRVLGNDHPDVARALNNLAGVLEKQGDLKAAEPLYRESLSIKRETLGANHISTAYSLANLGLLLLTKEDYTSSKPLLEESLGIRRKNFNSPHPEIAQGINNLATLYARILNYPKAASLYREELAMRTSINPIDSLQVSRTKIGLGTCLSAMQQFEEAETLLLESYVELQNFEADQPEELQNVLHSLTALYTDWKKPGQVQRYQALLTQ